MDNSSVAIVASGKQYVARFFNRGRIKLRLSVVGIMSYEVLRALRM